MGMKERRGAYRPNFIKIANGHAKKSENLVRSVVECPNCSVSSSLFTFTSGQSLRSVMHSYSNERNDNSNETTPPPRPAVSSRRLRPGARVTPLATGPARSPSGHPAAPSTILYRGAQRTRVPGQVTRHYSNTHTVDSSVQHISIHHLI